MSATIPSDQIQRLADLLQRPPSQDDDLSWLSDAAHDLQLSSDELAAEHYRVLVHELMPAASVFLAQDAMLGGDIGRSVQEFMSAHDHQPTSPTDPPDHLAEEVRFLEYLLAADHREAASNFFTHLGGWAPLCLSVISTSGSVLFESVAEALKDALFEFGHNLPQSAGLDLFHPSLTPGPVTFQLEHSRTGLAQIGSFFSTPAQCGIYLSKSRISRLARQTNLPTGFGSRARTIEGLFRSAGQCGGMDTVCRFLEEEIEATQLVWQSWKDEEIPGSRHWAAFWSSRLDSTRSIVRRLGDS